MTLRSSIGLLMLWLTAGCGTHLVTRGADLYAGGYYIEAAEVFEHSERRLPDYSTGERARYGLYRGATLLALGDVSRADNWLVYSAEIEKGHPSTLTDEERQMLSRALELSVAHRTDRSRGVLQTPAKVAATAALPVNAHGVEQR
ncbi:MAG TPA: hypothetical protein VFQ61_14365 [Polyangiaceae bacterium]|nr:hypothetical protein [Polyangiaceae bacterium]